MEGMMRFISEVYWDKGGRSANQDTVSVQEVQSGSQRALFALVCDGMGGLWEGGEASGYVAEQMTEWFYREGAVMLRKHKSGKKLLRAGLRVLFECNEQMNCFARERDIRFGTTLTALLLVKRKYYVWHSGDSGLYRMTSFGGRDRAKCLTRMHEAGAYALTKCIGSFSWRQPDIISGRLLPRDSVFLLCTDGFHRRTGEECFRTALCPREISQEKQMGRRLKELAEFARRHGETDNLTAVAIRTG